MMNPKWTKGSWEAHFAHWGDGNVVSPCSDADWDGKLRINGLPYLRVTGDINPDDAVLTAAAKDLYAALDRLVLEASDDRSKYGMHSEIGPALEAARAALAKANQKPAV